MRPSRPKRPPLALLTALLAISALLLAACGGATTDGGGDEDGSSAPMPEDGEGGDSGSSDSREVTLARTDAAERTGVAEDDIELEELSMVTWSDGALGCPEPGMAYTQALVDGYRIVLDAAGQQLVYHGAIGDDPFYCEDPQEPASHAG